MDLFEGEVGEDGRPESHSVILWKCGKCQKDSDKSGDYRHSQLILSPLNTGSPVDFQRAVFLFASLV